MKSNPIKLVVLLLLITGFAATALADGSNDLSRQPNSKREQVRKKIETLKMWRLTQALELDERSAARVFPVLNTYDRKRATMEHQIKEDLDALRETLGRSDLSGIKDTLERIEGNHKTLQNLRYAEHDELKRILTIEQQAQFILFQEDFTREMRKLIRDSREQH